MDSVSNTMIRSEQLRVLLEDIRQAGLKLPTLDDDMASAFLLVCVVNGVQSIGEEDQYCTQAQRAQVLEAMQNCLQSATRLFDRLWALKTTLH